MSSAGVVAIVDTYAPTRGLGRKFMELGYTCIRVQSTAEVPPVYRAAVISEGYADNISHVGDFDDTVRRVAKHEPNLVIAGGELGVELADQLSEALGLITNGTALSHARRNKYAQIETIRRAGLRGARQHTSADEAEIVEWHRQVGGRIVVKPPRSAGGDGVHFCDTLDQTLAACRAILASTDVFAARNVAVVAQEYLLGTEYVVNTASRDGRHHVCDITAYDKMHANGVPDLICGFRLLPRDGEAQRQLVPYVFDVLDALGIRHGPGHAEVKLTPDGPCLIEIGARLSGLSVPYLTPAAIGDSQIDWTVRAYTDPAGFLAHHQDGYHISKHLAAVCMVAPRDGILRGYPRLSQIEALETLHSINTLTAVGSHQKRTVDDTGWPMVVNLAHPVEELVRRDANTVRQLDGTGFYDFEESPA